MGPGHVNTGTRNGGIIYVRYMTAWARQGQRAGYDSCKVREDDAQNCFG